MALKVLVAMQVTAMDGTEIAAGQVIDTVINVNPADPTGEPLLAAQTIARLTNDTLETMQERLQEYAQMLGRILT